VSNFYANECLNRQALCVRHRKAGKRNRDAARRPLESAKEHDVSRAQFSGRINSGQVIYEAQLEVATTYRFTLVH
jgi:hypothetical protein